MIKYDLDLELRTASSAFHLPEETEGLFYPLSTTEREPEALVLIVATAATAAAHFAATAAS